MSAIKIRTILLLHYVGNDSFESTMFIAPSISIDDALEQSIKICPHRIERAFMQGRVTSTVAGYRLKKCIATNTQTNINSELDKWLSTGGFVEHDLSKFCK